MRPQLLRVRIEWARRPCSLLLLGFHHFHQRPSPSLVGKPVAVVSVEWAAGGVLRGGRSQSMGRWDAGTLGRRKRPAHRTHRFTRNLLSIALRSPLPVPATTLPIPDRLRCFLPRSLVLAIAGTSTRPIFIWRSLPEIASFRLRSAPKSLRLSCPRSLSPLLSAFPGVIYWAVVFPFNP